MAYDTAMVQVLLGRLDAWTLHSRNLEFRQTAACRRRGAAQHYYFVGSVDAVVISHLLLLELVSPISFIIRTFSFGIREQISSKEVIGA